MRDFVVSTLFAATVTVANSGALAANVCAEAIAEYERQELSELKNVKNNVRLSYLISKIVNNIEVKTFDFELINAFAFQNTIFVSSRMLELTDEELLFVLAHEFMHVKNKDFVKQLFIDKDCNVSVFVTESMRRMREAVADREAVKLLKSLNLLDMRAVERVVLREHTHEASLRFNSILEASADE